MTRDAGAGSEQVLDAARRGDGDAFQVLISPRLRALHLHRYQMLGSYTEAEEAVQEAMLRAWRGLSGFEGRAPLRHWLYRIATTTCLGMIASGTAPITTTDVAWLSPTRTACSTGSSMPTRLPRSSTTARCRRSRSSPPCGCSRPRRALLILHASSRLRQP